MFNQSTLRLYDISPCYEPSSFTLSFALHRPAWLNRWRIDFQNLPDISKVTTPKCLTFGGRWVEMCLLVSLRIHTRWQEGVYIGQGIIASSNENRGTRTKQKKKTKKKLYVCRRTNYARVTWTNRATFLFLNHCSRNKWKLDVFDITYSCEKMEEKQSTGLVWTLFHLHTTCV